MLKSNSFVGEGSYEDLIEVESRRMIIQDFQNSIDKKKGNFMDEETSDNSPYIMTDSDCDEILKDYVDLNSGNQLFRLPKIYKINTPFGVEQARWVVEYHYLLERFVQKMFYSQKKSRDSIDEELEEFVDGEYFRIPALGRKGHKFKRDKAKWIIEHIELFECFVNRYGVDYETGKSQIMYNNGNPVFISPRIIWGGPLEIDLGKAEWIIKNIDLIKIFVEIHNNSVKEDKIENYMELEERIEQYHHHNFGRPTFLVPRSKGESYLQFGLNKASWIIDNINQIEKFVEKYGNRI